MQAINAFFASNRALIYFVGGLSFFSMGLASLLQRRRHSRLRLARWLSLLAWFGLLYGLSEWLNLLIPLQSPLPIPASVTRLAVLQLIARAVSLALLFQFGIRLLRPTGRRWPLLPYLPSAFVLIWVGALTHLWVGMRAPTEIVFSTGDLLARYLMGVPGAALSCLGLLDQRREVREAGFPQIARYLLGAAISLGFFGVVGVLLAVAGPFFPGDWLAQPAVLYAIGVFVPILRTLDGAAMAYTTGQALSVFEVETETLMAEIERRNLLLADRERISRELHDGIIQSLYAAGLRLEDAYHTVEESTESTRSKIGTVMDGLSHVIQQIRAYIFDLQAAQDNSTLAQRLNDMVRDVRLNTMLEGEFYVCGPRCDVPADRVTQLCQIAQEALSNVIRHAHARRVQVNLFFSPEDLRLQVQDDGQGFDMEQLLRGGQGMGLRNMRERAAMLGGQLHVDSQPGVGTRVEVQVPCLCEKGRQVKEVTQDDIRAMEGAHRR